MKYLISACFFVVFSILLNGQSLNPRFGYAYFNAQKQSGIVLANDFVFGKLNHKVIFGFEFGFSEGNRNFDRDRKEDYNLEYYDGNSFYAADYGTFKGSSFFVFEDAPVIYGKARTSVYYNYNLRLGYQYEKPYKKGVLFGNIGGFGAYVHQIYIKEILYDINVKHIYNGSISEIDLVILRNVRYFEPGLFAGIGCEFTDYAKIPFGVKLDYVGFNVLGWFTASVYMKLGLK